MRKHIREIVSVAYYDVENLTHSLIVSHVLFLVIKFYAGVRKKDSDGRLMRCMEFHILLFSMPRGML